MPELITPPDLANEPEPLNPELVEALLGALADLQTGRTVNWAEIKPEYRPLVRRLITPGPNPPDLTAFAVYCETCEAERTVHMATVHMSIPMSKEADAETGEVYYYEYICDECFTIVLTITPVKLTVSS